jgi:hypothetical protein
MFRCLTIDTKEEAKARDHLGQTQAKDEALLAASQRRSLTPYSEGHIRVDKSKTQA